MKKYVIEAVFDDPDFGVIGSERWFIRKSKALSECEKMERARNRINEQTPWHYQVRNVQTDEVLT